MARCVQLLKLHCVGMPSKIAHLRQQVTCFKMVLAPRGATPTAAFRQTKAVLFCPCSTHRGTLLSMPNCSLCAIKLNSRDGDDCRTKWFVGALYGWFRCCACANETPTLCCRHEECAGCQARVSQDKQKRHQPLAPQQHFPPPALQMADCDSTGHGSAINPPGRWPFFLSHVQGEAAKEALDLWVHLHGWLDVKMRNKGEAAMMEGVRCSDVFLLILTESYFDRPFCVKELRMAAECRKKTVLVHTPATKPKLSSLFQKAAAMGFGGLGSEESVELILNDPDYAAVTIKKIREKCG